MIWLTKFHYGTFQDFIWSLKQDLPFLFFIGKNLTLVRGVAKDTIPFRNMGEKGNLLSSSCSVYWKEVEEGRFRPLRFTHWEKRIHPYISVCCLSPVKDPQRTGYTQIKEEVQVDTILILWVSARQTLNQHCAVLDSSAWEPGKLAAGNMCIF